MANTVYRGSDTTPTVVLATQAAPTTDTPTAWIDVRAFTHVDFMWVLSSGNSVTDIQVSRVDFAMTDQGNPEAFPLMLEEYVAGPLALAKQSVYVVDADGVFSGSAGVFSLPVPVQGLFMRCVFKCGPSASGDQITVNAIRRTT